MSRLSERRRKRRWRKVGEKLVGVREMLAGALAEIESLREAGSVDEEVLDIARHLALRVLAYAPLREGVVYGDDIVPEMVEWPFGTGGPAQARAVEERLEEQGVRVVKPSSSDPLDPSRRHLVTDEELRTAGPPIGRWRETPIPDTHPED